MIVFQMKKKANDRIAHEIRIIDVAIKTSTRMYIFLKGMKSSVRKILQLLSIRYKRFDQTINLQLHEKLQRLKIVSTKKNHELRTEKIWKTSLSRKNKKILWNLKNYLFKIFSKRTNHERFYFAILECRIKSLQKNL